jgi:DNA-binding winged helix-turn-helix (wHTH) protein
MRELIQQSYSFDEFTLDLGRGCLLGSNQQEIKLRPKAFITLKYLVENNGRLISKDELIEAVWPDTAVTDNSLVQCLKEVREALGDKSQNYIKTVPRRGYIFTHLNGRSRLASVHRIEDVEARRVVIDEQKPALNGSYPDRDSLSSISKRRGSIGRKSLPLGLARFGSVRRYFLVPSKSARPQKIAVLPFRSLSNDENDKYLRTWNCRHVNHPARKQQEIIVRPTSSIQKLVSSDQDSITAGREQQVDAVLEGSIQRSGDRVR